MTKTFTLNFEGVSIQTAVDVTQRLMQTIVQREETFRVYTEVLFLQVNKGSKAVFEQTSKRIQCSVTINSEIEQITNYPTKCNIVFFVVTL